MLRIWQVASFFVFLIRLGQFNIYDTQLKGNKVKRILVKINANCHIYECQSMLDNITYFNFNSLCYLLL